MRDTRPSSRWPVVDEGLTALEARRNATPVHHIAASTPRGRFSFRESGLVTGTRVDGSRA